MSTAEYTALSKVDTKPTKKCESQITVTTTPISDDEMSHTATSSETEWKITIKSSDGAASEVTLAPTNTTNPTRQEVNIYMPAAKKADDDGADMEKAKAEAAPPSRKLRYYTIIQQLLTTLFSLIIIAVEALTLIKYRSTQSVAGAWPANPLLSPTYVLLSMAVLSCAADFITLGVNCCYGKVKTTLMTVVQRIRASLGILQAIANAVGSGYFVSSNVSSGGNDLWGWSCSTGADAMQKVNASATLCMTNTAAWWISILQTALHVLTVVMAVWVMFNPKGTFQEHSEAAVQLFADRQDQETKIQMDFGAPAAKKA